LFIGIAFFFVASIDLVHTLAYKGMGVFPAYDANLPTQLWIIARALECLSLLAALAFVRRKLDASAVVAGYVLITGLLLWSAFARVFPACYIEGLGLTPFKKISEYVISALLLGALILLLRKRHAFEPAVLRWLTWSIVATIIAELAFTFYVSVYGFSNMLGHLLKVVAFFLVYKAIIETALTRPYDLLLRDLKQREGALQQSEGALRAIIESSSQSVILLDAEGRVAARNERARVHGQSALGRPPQVGAPASDFLPPAMLSDFMPHFRSALAGQRRRTEWQPPGAAGASTWYELQYNPVTGDGGRIIGVCLTAEEITQRKLQEARLREAQRLESIGLLAGGVAHEFNNMLAAILTRTSLASRALEADHPARTHIVRVTEPAQQAAELVRQLLAYAGKGQHTLEPIDLSQLIRDHIELLRTTGHGQIRFDLRLAPDLPKIDADRGQLQQLVTNLVVNAVEAITADQGAITITTASCALAPDAAADEFAGNHLPAAGRYVCLAVTDTGAGIDPAIAAHIFEPFATTKFTGRGLGLPAALGIVRACGGGIQVQSAPEDGATFTVWLPAVEDPTGASHV
jgi:PAS domain S-box-containing protein